MGKLKVGFGRADITPPEGLYMPGYFYERRGEGYLDRLTGSCIAVSDGEKTAVIFSLDLIGINQAVGDQMRKIIAERAGLPVEAVYYACTHTHTGVAVGDHIDEAYNSVLFRTLADAAKAAIADLTEAEIRAARGKVEGISFIRRFRMKNGMFSWNLPDVEGPSDTSATGMIMWGVLKMKERGLLPD